VFVLGKLFQPGLMFAGMAKAYLSGAPLGPQLLGRLLFFSANI